LAHAGAQLVRQPASTLGLPPELPTASGYTTQNALGALTFAAPMVTADPGDHSDRLFIAERGGAIQVVTALSTTPGKAAYFNLSSLLAAGQTLRTDGENGFLSLVFHPNFATNGTFFVYFSIEVGGSLFQRLHQVTVTNPAANTATVLIAKPLLTILDRETNHNGGDLHFGSDGYLYLTLGDEGAGGDSRDNARYINHRNDATVHRTGFWGKLLRLAVEFNPQPLVVPVFPPGSIEPNPHVQNSAAFPTALHGNYRIPGDNPFIGYTLWHSVAIDPLTVRTEIYATGLRNPFRWSFDPPTGRIFIGDVGQNIYEEIDLVSKGDDLGWSWREGLHQYFNPPAPVNAPLAPNPGDPPGTGFSRIDPIYEYDHTNDGIGNDAIIYGPNVTGGMVYRGNRLTELYGAYIFAEFGNGFIVALREQANGSWTATRLATDNNLVHFGPDPRNGDVIFCDLGSGTVKRLVRSGTAGTQPPALLSQTGVFSDLATLTPNPGVVPYEPNVAFWTDYAVKSRWFAIKNASDTVAFSADGNWTLPAGMVWIKHFDIDTTRGNPATRRRLETRILVKTATDVYGLCYKWRADQTDADLVAENGLNEVIPASSPTQTWHYPSRSECRTCHTPVAGFALSFDTRQMNRTHPYGVQTPNQIAALSGAGYFAAPVANVNVLPAFAPAGDATQSLEWRVRSYLAVNCGQCHQPGGASVGNWDARATTPTDAAQLINGALVNNAGDAANRWAVPGDLAHSMILKRLQGNGVNRMPPLDTNQRDLASEQLVSDWITQVLPTRQSLTDWQTQFFGSPGNPNAAPTADPDGDGENNGLEFLLRTSPIVPGAPWPIITTIDNGTFQLTFDHPANRSCLVETTTDFQAWSLWDVPGNAPYYPTFTTPRILTAPLDSEQRFFRLRLGEP
jgi:glucose/arabinose dehydrogenase/mono/diheme cytochrome c family protein